METNLNIDNLFNCLNGFEVDDKVKKDLEFEVILNFTDIISASFKNNNIQYITYLIADKFMTVNNKRTHIFECLVSEIPDSLFKAYLEGNKDLREVIENGVNFYSIRATDFTNPSLLKLNDFPIQHLELVLKKGFYWNKP